MPFKSPFAILPFVGLLLGLMVAVIIRPTYTEAAATLEQTLPNPFSSAYIGESDPNARIPLRTLLSWDHVDKPFRASVENTFVFYITLGFMGAGALLFALPRRLA